MLYLGLFPGEYIGWGVCSKYLIREIRKLTETEVLDVDKIQYLTNKTLNGEVFHTIGDHHLTKVFDVTGKKNYGYTFFENTLPKTAKENASAFDIVFAGSTWCRDRLIERGITWVDVLIQGIDPELFYPLPAEKSNATDYFVIFSGGKFELRKGQDIVIRAVKVIQERHKDVIFVNCWHNSWPFCMNTMAYSPFIEYTRQDKWSIDYLKKLLSESGIDLNRTEFLPRVPQNQFRKVYDCTDIGLFPNRCEGGTNLVLMEYMACGKPTIVSLTSGHTDIINDKNSLPLKQMQSFEMRNRNGGIEALWEEPDLEEVIEKIEYAYQYPDKVKELGIQAGKDMKKLTWKDTAEYIVEKLGLQRREEEN